MENRKPVVLQAHLDMVPQKNNDTVHDFTKDPIQPYIDGEWVKARGTTLGADNGIGMASALAVLADENVVHGPLEVLLTMTEEAGMDGAFGLQSNWLQVIVWINTNLKKKVKSTWVVRGVSTSPPTCILIVKRFQLVLKPSS